MRDLSDIYKYAHDLKGNNCEDLYDKQNRSLKSRIRQEHISYKKRAQANIKKYSGNQFPKAIIWLAVILLIIAVIVLMLLAGGTNDDLPESSAGQSESCSEPITLTSSGVPDDVEPPVESTTSIATTADKEQNEQEPSVTSTINSTSASDNADEPTDEPTEETNEEFTVQSYHGYQLGDIVNYSGTVHYTSSYTNQLKGACHGGLAMISAINPDGIHPFHLVAIDDTSNVYGWVDEYFMSAS